MVSITKRSCYNSPSLIEVYAFLVDEDALEFDDRQGGMGIVELDSDIVG